MICGHGHSGPEGAFTTPKLYMFHTHTIFIEAMSCYPEIPEL